MPIPVNYRKSGEIALANYNYTDIAEGTGIVNYYGYDTGISGAATSLYLTTNSFPSHSIESGRVFNATPETENWTFDLSPYSLPKIIKGTATVSFSWQLTTLKFCYFEVYFQKISNEVVTTIATCRSSQPISDATPQHTTLVVSIPQTNFKKGDNLRIIIYAISTDGATLYLGHDPANRNGVHITPSTTYPTIMEIGIPYKLDL